MKGKGLLISGAILSIIAFGLAAIFLIIGMVGVMALIGTSMADGIYVAFIIVSLVPLGLNIAALATKFRFFGLNLATGIVTVVMCWTGIWGFVIGLILAIVGGILTIVGACQARNN